MTRFCDIATIYIMPIDKQLLKVYNINDELLPLMLVIHVPYFAGMGFSFKPDVFYCFCVGLNG